MKYGIYFFLLVLAPVLCRAASEDAVLQEINLARTHPHEYAPVLEARMNAIPGADGRCVAEAAAFLRRQHSLEPLQGVRGLTMSARQHVNEQGATGDIGHRSPDGAGPFSRMAHWGQWTGRAGENISYGYADARTIVATLIVDQGVRDRGHRKNIFYKDFKVAGAACGPHARYGTMCVIDFAEGFVEKGDRVAMVDSWGGAGQ